MLHLTVSSITISHWTICTSTVSYFIHFQTVNISMIFCKSTFALNTGWRGGISHPITARKSRGSIASIALFVIFTNFTSKRIILISTVQTSLAIGYLIRVVRLVRKIICIVGKDRIFALVSSDIQISFVFRAYTISFVAQLNIEFLNNTSWVTLVSVNS